MSTTPTVFILGAGFSAAEQFPLVRGLRDRVLHFLEAEQHSAYRGFLAPGNGGFREGQFRAGLNAIDPSETLAFEELLIELSKQNKTTRNDDPSFITERVLRIGAHGSYGAFRIRYGVLVRRIRTLRHGCATVQEAA